MTWGHTEHLLTAHDICLLHVKVCFFFLLRQSYISYFPCYHGKILKYQKKKLQREGAARWLSRWERSLPICAQGALCVTLFLGRHKQTFHFTTKVELGKPVSLLGGYFQKCGWPQRQPQLRHWPPTPIWVMLEALCTVCEQLNRLESLLSSLDCSHSPGEREGPCEVVQFQELLRLSRLFSFWVLTLLSISWVLPGLPRQIQGISEFETSVV